MCIYIYVCEQMRLPLTDSLMYFVYVISNEQVAEVLHIIVNTEISNDKTKVLCVRVIIMFFNENVPALAATL